VTEKERFRVTE